MRKVLFLATLALSLAASAGERSRSEMRSIAQRYLPIASYVKGQTSQNPDSQLRCTHESQAYAVFEQTGTEAFVVVSKSNLAPEVIGYSQTTFSEESMSPDLRWFLSLAESNILAAERTGKPLQTSRRAPQQPVDPFITTLWTQSDPFNLKTPRNYPAGCVAVAMAQAINYCRHPSRVNFRGYCYVTETDNSKRYVVDSLDINAIYFYPYLDLYGRATTAQKNSVASLVRDCGYATFMRYAKSGSGTYLFLAGSALTTYYSYPEESVKYAERDCFGGTQEEWNQIIYDEMQLRCPVLYGGADEDAGGHAFVFCGLDADGLVYVNWGWGASGNGFYDIALLNPAEDQYTVAQNMVYGLRSKALPTDKPEPRIYSYDGEPYTFSFTNETDDEGQKHVTLNISVTAGLANMTPCKMDGEFGIFGTDITTGQNWQIRDTDKDIWEPGAGFTLQSPSMIFYYYVEKEMIPGHTYRISFGTRDKREGQWHSIIANGGELGYEIYYTGDPATCTISEQMKPLYDGVAAPRTSSLSATDGMTRVYDTAGRLIYTAPTTQFNLWDVPARGILVVEQGGQSRKVVR